MQELWLRLLYVLAHTYWADLAMVITMSWHVQAQQRVCPPIFQAIKPAEQHDAVGFDRGQSIPVQPKGADPEWLPAANLSRASSEGGEANQGRCKCGESPPALSGCIDQLPVCLCFCVQWP